MSETTMQFYMHTPKAVRNGEPEDRVFAVVGKLGQRLVAWKCQLRRDGVIHPANFKKPIPFDKLEKLFVEQGPGGEGPTAEFKPDSFYTEVTLADLKIRASKMPEPKAEKHFKRKTISLDEIRNLHEGDFIQINMSDTLDPQYDQVVMLLAPVKLRKYPNGTFVAISAIDEFGSMYGGPCLDTSLWYLVKHVMAVRGRVAFPKPQV